MADRCIGYINDLRCSRPNAHDGPCSFADPEAAQLRRDRDELLEALIEEHANSAPIAPCYEPCSPISSCRVCTLLARVKGR